jgi:hypothetical protein
MKEISERVEISDPGTLDSGGRAYKAPTVKWLRVGLTRQATGARATRPVKTYVREAMTA